MSSESQSASQTEQTNEKAYDSSSIKSITWIRCSS